MDMKVEDLLDQFHDFKILAGEEGLSKKVNTVSVMDAPDIYNWMKGGEFLITTAYIMKDNPSELKNLVQKLNEHGASALGIKLGRFIEVLPKEVKEIGDALNFSIIYIPEKYAFTDIINPVLSKLVSKQARKIVMSEKIHKSFTQIVVDGKDNTEIMKALYKILDKDVAFINLIFKVNYYSCNSKEFKNDLEHLEIINIKKKYCNHQVKINDTIFGYLVVDSPLEDCLTEIDKITVEHASTVIKLNIQKEISNRQIEQRYRDEFIQDLIINNVKSKEEVNTRAAIHGWEMKKGLVCLIVDIDDFKERFNSLKSAQNSTKESQEIFQLVIDQMKIYFKQSFYTFYSDYIVFLVEMDTPKNEDFFSKLKNVSDTIRMVVRQKSNFTVTIAIGEYKEVITDVYLSFIEAQKAREIGRIIYRKDTTNVYSDLGAYKALYKIASEKDTIKFCDEHLRAIIEYDLKNNTELMNTLEAIIKNDWNLKLTSEEMFVHYNTIKYRFNKICKLLKLDLKKREDKFAVELSLKLISMNVRS